jgi:hypothetical protein
VRKAYYVKVYSSQEEAVELYHPGWSNLGFTGARIRVRCNYSREAPGFQCPSYPLFMFFQHWMPIMD